jgi:hypothetical protein
MQKDSSVITDELVVTMERPRSAEDGVVLEGILVAEMYDEFMVLKKRVEVHNLITTVGDIMYMHRGSGATSPPNAPTGMRIGTGSTAVAKTGAGAAIVTKITLGNKAFDATFPSLVSNVVTYKTTYAPGEGTTASPVTEAVIVNDTIGTDTATAAANTISRALISGVGSKAAGDTLVLTWTHTGTGA